MPYLVRKNLFISDITDAAEILENGSEEITHLLSALSSVLISFFSEWRSSLLIPAKEIRVVNVGSLRPGDGSGDSSKSVLSPEKLLYSLEYAGKDLKLVRMAVPIRDMETENLLDYLDVCLDFIDQSRREGSILVHCFAGVSRSAAIITAYLMRSENLSQEDALESLQKSCEFVSPNEGFLKQLKMYEGMGFKVDHNSQIYKRFRLDALADSYYRGDKRTFNLGTDPGLPTEEISSAGTGIVTPAYRCKKCRRVVALQENVVDHVPGKDESSERTSRNNSFNNRDEMECSSLFVEPLRWMTEVGEGELAGKLDCAHCKGRLGNFNWSGIQCSCGRWITPAFQIHKSRVDISTV